MFEPLPAPFTSLGWQARPPSIASVIGIALRECDIDTVNVLRRTLGQVPTHQRFRTLAVDSKLELTMYKLGFLK